MPTNDGRTLRYDTSNPEDMQKAVLNGLIWVSPDTVQMGIDYVVKHKLKSEDLKNMPDDLRKAIFG